MEDFLMLDRTKVAFNAFWWENLDSEDKVAAVCEGLSALGYRGVEWKETCFGAGNETASKLAMAARATRNAGLEVTNFVILRNIADPEAAAKSVEDMCQFVRAAAAAGVKIVNTASASALRKPLDPDDWWKADSPDWTTSWDTTEKSLRAVLAVAEAEGVTIAFEAVVGNLVHDYYSTLELLRRLDSPSLALTMDPSHYALHDNDIGWAVRQLGPKIRHVHLKDTVGRAGAFPRDFLFPVLGEGIINWKEFFTALDESSYHGWLSIEFESFKYMAEILSGDAMEAARLSMRSYKALSGC
jgi:sugar phosphate isomerase/epimerase